MGSCLSSNSNVVCLSSNNVVIKKQIAEGGFSFVFICHIENKPGKYALKQVLCQEPAQVESVKKEMDMHRMFLHEKNILKLLDSAVVLKKPSNKKNTRPITEAYLLFPFYAGTLFDVVLQHQEDRSLPWPFTELLCLSIFQEICVGVAAMHAKRVAHLDIKPHNVLYDISRGPGDQVVLMDLGSAVKYPIEVSNRNEALRVQEMAGVNCSAPYRAPELWDVDSHCVIKSKPDIWSLGCLLYCMAFGENPFESPTEGVMPLGIMNGTVKFPAKNKYRGVKYSYDFTNLISLLLTVDPAKRPSISEVVTTTVSLLKNAKRRAEKNSGDSLSNNNSLRRELSPVVAGGDMWVAEFKDSVLPVKESSVKLKLSKNPGDSLKKTKADLMDLFSADEFKDIQSSVKLRLAQADSLKKKETKLMDLFKGESVSAASATRGRRSESDFDFNPRGKATRSESDFDFNPRLLGSPREDDGDSNASSHASSHASSDDRVPLSSSMHHHKAS